jgi:hypothetical protein
VSAADHFAAIGRAFVPIDTTSTDRERRKNNGCWGDCCNGDDESDEPPDSRDLFIRGIVDAEFAANWGNIDCAACGSADICRTPMAAPDHFATLHTADSDGKPLIHGYALCRPCRVDFEAARERVNANFDRLGCGK